MGSYGDFILAFTPPRLQNIPLLQALLNSIASQIILCNADEKEVKSTDDVKEKQDNEWEEVDDDEPLAQDQNNRRCLACR